MYCCRAGHSIRKQILSLIYPKEPVVEQTTDSNITKIEYISSQRIITKYRIWDNEARVLTKEELNKIFKEKVEAPWLSIGSQTIFGHFDNTELMDQYLVPNNTITLKFLEETYPYFYDWKYLDSQTFEEVDFPAEGITINDSGMETNPETSKESGSPK
jgi:hypothetical protein